MAEFVVNPQRFDPYKNFKFRVEWDGKLVAGVSKVSGLRRTTEVVSHREGGDLSAERKSPGRTEFKPIVLERGVTHDHSFEGPIRYGRVTLYRVRNCRSRTFVRMSVLSC